MDLFNKVKIAYIHFIRKPLFVLLIKTNFIKIKKLKPNFFFDSNDYLSEEFRKALSSIEDESKILNDADLVLQNNFQTLGSDVLYLGDKINWHCDYKSGRVWEKLFYTKIDSKASINKSDIKFPWELSRFHQSLWLAKAFVITKDEKYSKKFFELVDNWIEENPFCYGVNWNCPMEVAIRAVNWILALHIFRYSKFFDDVLANRIFEALYLHGIFIRNNLEFGRRNGNHYLSDLMGLVWIGAFLGKYSFGKKWMKFARRELEKEINIEVYSDGVDYEKSTYYQRLVTEILFLSWLVLNITGMVLSRTFFDKLKLMFNFISSYIIEDEVPNVGDCDDGKVIKFSFDEKVSEMRNFLSLGAVIFSDSRFKSIAEKPYSLILFLFGLSGIEKFNSIENVVVEKKSFVFPDGGFVVLSSENFKLFFDGGDIGMRGWGGHGHNDLLSFELAFKEKRFIVDSGTYVYTPEPEIRQKLRSTFSHNTIMIDEMELAEFLNLFRIKKDFTRPNLKVKKLNEDNYTEIECEHFTYARLHNPVVVRRRIVLYKENEKILVEDELNGNGEHKVDIFIHFHPEVKVERIDFSKFNIERNNLALAIEFISVENSEIKLEDYIYSESYGKLTSNKRIHLSFKKNITSEKILTNIYPI